VKGVRSSDTDERAAKKAADGFESVLLRKSARPDPRTNQPINEIEPLVVKPRIAWRMLGCSNTRGYELLKAGELDSFRDGRSRKILVKSIHAFIDRRLAAARGTRSPKELATERAVLSEDHLEGVD
jgi:hypothetical protein